MGRPTDDEVRNMPDASFNTVGKGDFIKTRSGYKEIESVTISGDKRDWEVKTIDGLHYSGFSILRYKRNNK